MQHYLRDMGLKLHTRLTRRNIKDLRARVFLKEMSIISGQLWWPVFSAGIGVLLILRGIMIYENTKYWSNDKGAFIGGAFFILLSLLSFVNFASLVNWWSVIIVILGISMRAH